MGVPYFVDLTARPLDPVVHVQLTRLEVDRLPGEPVDFTPADLVVRTCSAPKPP